MSQNTQNTSMVKAAHPIFSDFYKNWHSHKFYQKVVHYFLNKS
jgi:hypothetical protein